MRCNGHWKGRREKCGAKDGEGKKKLIFLNRSHPISVGWDPMSRTMFNGPAHRTRNLGMAQGGTIHTWPTYQHATIKASYHGQGFWPMRNHPPERL
jgi:hypothetical protein